MNEKDSVLNRIIDNTISCCSVLDNEGRATVSRELVMSRCRKENVVMTRVLVANQIIAGGYTVSTACVVLGRSPQAIRQMCDKGYYLSRTSGAYRAAEREASILNQQE